MRNCKNCGKEFDDAYDFCPNCGYTYEEETNVGQDKIDTITECNETEIIPPEEVHSNKKGFLDTLNGIKGKVFHKHKRRNPLSKKQKLIIIIIASIVVVAAVIIPIAIHLHNNPVLRAHGTFGDGFSWEFDRKNGTLTIQGEGDLPESPWPFSGGWKYGNVVQHVVLENGITSIGGNFFDNWDFTTISIPNSVTAIKESAFMDCYQLTSVTIPEGVTVIGTGAFEGCSSLLDVSIPDSIEVIGNYAFRYCGSLTEVTIPGSVNTIGNYAFAECESLTEVTIYEGVETIGYHAFEDCVSLAEIAVPDSAETIGAHSFHGCTSLYDVTFSESAEDSGEFQYIGDYAFCETAIRSVHIPLSVMKIGNSCFSGCSDLGTVEFDPGCWIEEIGECAFKNCSSLSSVNFEEYYYQSLETLGEYVFYGCSSLEKLTIPEGVEEIGDYAFGDCLSLKSLTLPASVTFLGEGILLGTDNCKISTENAYVLAYLEDNTYLPVAEKGKCGEDLSWTYDSSTQTLTIAGEGEMDTWERDSDSYSMSTAPWAQKYPEVETVVIEDGVTSIGAYAFYQYEYLTTASVPDSVTSIGDNAFDECEELTNIELPKKLTEIGDWAFSGCRKITSIELSDTVSSIGNSAFSGCKSLTSIAFSNALKEIPDSAFYGCSSLKSVTIPNGVTRIGDAAFMDCEDLASVSIPDSVLQIDGGDGWEGPSGSFGATAWFDKQPNGMVYLGKVAYAYKGEMPKNTSITIKAGTKAIAGGAFSRCTGLTSISIPSSVRSIGDAAFGGCTGMESITIPGSVNYVGANAFWGWTPLQTIYASSSSGWNSYWSEGCTAEIKKVDARTTTVSETKKDRWLGIF